MAFWAQAGATSGVKGTPSQAREPRNNAYFTALALSFRACDPFTWPVLDTSRPLGYF